MKVVYLCVVEIVMYVKVLFCVCFMYFDSEGMFILVYDGVIRGCDVEECFVIGIVYVLNVM